MRDYITISSRENEKVKLFTKLCESKKVRRENGMFALEGLRLISDAVAENAKLHCVFITESMLIKHSDALNFLDSKSISTTYIVTDELGKKMSLTEGTQGIFAVCQTIDKISISDKINNDGRYVVLYNIQDPGNMGTIIRTADAVGIDAVITVNCCDIYNPKVTRSTMGSIFRMPVVDTDADTMFTVFNEKKIRSYAAVIDTDALSLRECMFESGSAVLIGNEGNGLPQEAVQQCTARLTIRMNGNINSLNAAMAAGIIMWELVKKQ